MKLNQNSTCTNAVMRNSCFYSYYLVEFDEHLKVMEENQQVWLFACAMFWHCLCFWGFFGGGFFCVFLGWLVGCFFVWLVVFWGVFFLGGGGRFVLFLFSGYEREIIILLSYFQYQPFQPQKKYLNFDMHGQACIGILFTTLDGKPPRSKTVSFST